jgi:hypothetical protein
VPLPLPLLLLLLLLLRACQHECCQHSGREHLAVLRDAVGSGSSVCGAFASSSCCC